MAQQFPIASQRGQGLSEYVIILAGISLAVLLILVGFGGRLKMLFSGADGEVDELASEVLADLGSDNGLRSPSLRAPSLRGGNSTDSSTRQPPRKAARNRSTGATTRASTTARAGSGHGNDNPERPDLERRSAFEDPADPAASGGDEPAINLLISGIVGLLALGLAIVARLGLAAGKDS